jgi:hypothetical protein
MVARIPAQRELREQKAKVGRYVLVIRDLVGSPGVVKINVKKAGS